MRVLALVFALATIVAEMQGQVSKQPFGKTPDGTQVDIYTLKSGKIEARVITYGGILQSLKVPDKGGKSADVVLGFDSIDGYTGGAKPNPAFFGALIGRLSAGIGRLNYRQARKGVVAFSGTLAAARLFPGEFIHQHLDAYLEELRLAPALNALKFFI